MRTTHKRLLVFGAAGIVVLAIVCSLTVLPNWLLTTIARVGFNENNIWLAVCIVCWETLWYFAIDEKHFHVPVLVVASVVLWLCVTWEPATPSLLVCSFAFFLCWRKSEPLLLHLHGLYVIGLYRENQFKELVSRLLPRRGS